MKKAIQPDLKSIILKAFKHGFRMWSPTIPFEVNESENKVILKVDGSLQHIDINEVINDPIIQQLWPERM